MSIEDIDYLYKNSIKESVVTLVDSSTRNKFLYPKSNSYTIDFEEPFRYVYGVDILEASIPVSMYQIDKTNNTLFIYYPEKYNDIHDLTGDTRLREKHSPYYDVSGSNITGADTSGSSFHFYKIELEPGNYDLDQLISQINLLLELIIGPKTILCSSVFADSDDNTLTRSNDVQMKITFLSISGKDFYIIGHKSNILETLGFGDYSHSNSEATIPFLLPEDKKNYKSIDTHETLKLLLRTSNDISGGSISEVIASYTNTNTDFVLDNLDIKIEPDISGQDNYIIYLDDKKKGKDNPYNVLYSYKLSSDNDNRFNENNHVTRQLYTNSHIDSSLIPNSLTSKETVIQGEQYGNGTYLVGYNGLSSDNRPFNIFDSQVINNTGSYSVLKFDSSIGSSTNQIVKDLRLAIERDISDKSTDLDNITELNPIINAFIIAIDKRELIKNLSQDVKDEMNRTANKNSDTSGIYINPIVNVYEGTNNSGDISGFVDQQKNPDIKAFNTEKFFISFRELNNKNHTIIKDLYLPNSTPSNRYEFTLGDASGNTILGDDNNEIFNYGGSDTSGTKLIVIDWRLLLKEIRAPGIVNLAGGKNRFCVLRSNIIEKNLNSTVKYRKNSPGIALFKLNIEGYTEDRFDYTTVKYKAFHPIGKLSSIDFRFETLDGNLYDFKNTNHHFLLNIKFFVPYQKVSKRDYLLNSNYNPNLIKYRKNQMDKFNENELENKVVNNFNKEFLEKEKQYEYSSDEDLEYINKSESSESSDSSDSNSIDSDTSEETLNSNSNQYFNMNRTIYNSNYKDSIF